MPVNTPDLGPGGSVNAPFGLQGITSFAGGGFSSTSSLIAPFVVQGSASSFTLVAWSDVRARDIVLVTPFGAAISSISSGLIPHSHCTVNGQVEFRLSNVSTLAQNQSTITWIFMRLTPFVS